MPQLIEVAFKGNRREFFLWEADDAPPRAAAVVVDADRGEDVGRVHATGTEAEFRSARVPHGLMGAGPTRVARRLAAPDDVDRLAEIRAGDDEARRKAMERVKANGLVMKITDAEWQWDRKKLTFYFTAEKRVDFRTLVRELASLFRTRIELKQIGVRDEAKRLDGVGRCGRQYCSASWLPELRPVNLGVAKDQRLSLNPSQISGACGRLMCCLRYEHDFYVRSRRRYPKEGKIVLTGRGEEKVLAADIFRERVTLRGPDGELRIVPLADLRAEMHAAGDPLAALLDAAAMDRPLAAHEHTGEYPVHASHDEPGHTDEFSVPVQAARRPRPRERVASDAAHPGADASARPAVDDAGQAGNAPVAPAAEGEPRQQRRRGRRGGRRNRPSGERPAVPGERLLAEPGDSSHADDAPAGAHE